MKGAQVFTLHPYIYLSHIVILFSKKRNTMEDKNFLNVSLIAVKNLINEKLNNPFDSHEFIKAFSKEFEPEYVKLLQLHKNKPYRVVHAQIALNLLKNKDFFEIEKNVKVISETVFGFNNPNELWNKKR
jgi:hypothetical protein